MRRLSIEGRRYSFPISRRCDQGCSCGFRLGYGSGQSSRRGAAVRRGGRCLASRPTVWRRRYSVLLACPCARRRGSRFLRPSVSVRRRHLSPNRRAGQEPASAYKRKEQLSVPKRNPKNLNWLRGSQQGDCAIRKTSQRGGGRLGTVIVHRAGRGGERSRQQPPLSGGDGLHTWGKSRHETGVRDRTARGGTVPFTGVSLWHMPNRQETSNQTTRRCAISIVRGLFTGYFWASR